MRTFLNITCVALSIYYVFAASIHAPEHTPTEKRDLVNQIIDELQNLTSAAPPILTPTLCRNETQCLQNVTIEELSCRAQESFRTLERNITGKLTKLLETFNRVRKVACTFIHGKNEDKEDLKTAIARLLKGFREHNFAS